VGIILDLPTPGFDDNVWGTKVNGALSDLAEAVDATAAAVVPSTSGVPVDYVLTVTTPGSPPEFAPPPSAPPSVVVTHADLPSGLVLRVLEANGTYVPQSARNDLPREFVGTSDPAAVSREGDTWFAPS